MKLLRIGVIFAFSSFYLYAGESPTHTKFIWSEDCSSQVRVVCPASIFPVTITRNHDFECW